jgi:predicted ATP-dependent serine protease
MDLNELQQKYSISNIDVEPVETYRLQGYPVDFPVSGGTVNVLLGPPSVGKTSLALYLGIREAMQKQRYVLYYTWDWASQFLGTRASAWISTENLKKQDTFLFDDKGSVESLCSASKILPRGSMIIIDYLQVFPISQLPAGFSNGVEGRCSFLSELIQRLARRDGHMFFVLGAMNRESLKMKEEDQTLSSGYGTSKIEYSADSVVIASRTGSMDTHTLELRTKKNRWGMTQEICCFPFRVLEKNVVDKQEDNTERETDSLLKVGGGIKYD